MSTTDINDVLAAINAAPNANTGDPIADTLTWESNYVDHPAADVPHPDEAQTQPSTPTTPQRTSQGTRVAISRSGMTNAGLRKSRGLFAEADANTADYAASDAARTADESARMQEDYGHQQDAVQEERIATAYFQQKDQELQQKDIEFQQHAAQLEQRLAGESQAERAQYVSGYKEQLNVVRALAAQSGNPLSQLSKPEQLGLAGAQFAQGFLAAQGINIDVSGQVDRWVERSMQEHQMKIQNARASAEDQMHLYDIARQNSQDDYEARQRYRGFVIAGLQTSIQANASKFQSDVAMSRANAQVAKLQVEADATERAIGDAHQKRVQDFHNSQFEAAYKRGMLAREDARIALERQKAAWEMSDKNPKNQPKPGKTPELVPISDPEPVVGADGVKHYVNKWEVRRDDKDALEKSRDARAYTESVYRQLDDLETKRQKAYAAYGGAPFIGVAAALESPEVREYLRARKATIMTIRQATTGKAFTKEETKEYEDMLPTESGWQGGSNDSAIQQVREKLRTDFESKMNTYSEPQDVGQTASPTTAARTTATFHGETPEAGFAAVESAHATAKDSEKIETRNISGAWADFQRGQLANDPNEKIRLGQPEYAVAIDQLAAAFAKPHAFSSETTRTVGHGVSPNKLETPAEVRRDSYAAIKNLALGNSPDGRHVPPETMDYAAHVLNAIDADPALSAARDSETVEDISESPFVERLRWRPDAK